MRPLSKFRNQSGFSLLEVLITIMITLIALLGIALLQAKAQQAEMESYQRAQALVLLSDIVDRINIHRSTTSCFVITTNTTNGTPFIGTDNWGAGNHIANPSCAASTSNYNDQADAAIEAIKELLDGTAEKLGTDNVGGMIGARACISYDASTELDSVSGTGLYEVVVSWQALSDLVAPVNNCGNGLYGDETKRRAVSTKFRMANLYG